MLDVSASSLSFCWWDLWLVRGAHHHPRGALFIIPRLIMACPVCNGTASMV